MTRILLFFFFGVKIYHWHFWCLPFTDPQYISFDSAIPERRRDACRLRRQQSGADANQRARQSVAASRPTARPASALRMTMLKLTTKRMPHSRSLPDRRSAIPTVTQKTASASHCPPRPNARRSLGRRRTHAPTRRRRRRLASGPIGS